jgi:hypothetical protein
MERCRFCDRAIAPNAAICPRCGGTDPVYVKPYHAPGRNAIGRIPTLIGFYVGPLVANLVNMQFLLEGRQRHGHEAAVVYFPLANLLQTFSISWDKHSWEPIGIAFVTGIIATFGLHYLMKALKSRA